MTRDPPSIVRRLGATFCLAGILAGLPVVLSATAGPPTIHGLPGVDWIRDGLAYRYIAPDPILRLLILVAWTLWAYATLVTVLRVMTAIALGLRAAGGKSLLTVSNFVAVRPVRSLIDAAIGLTLLATTAVTQPRVTDPGRPAPIEISVQPQVLGQPVLDRDHARDHRLNILNGQGNKVGPHAAGGVALTAFIPPDPAADTACSGDVHFVHPGESYWSIARDRLGDPFRWPEIFALNRGRRMPDGAIVQRAELIRPNWPLLLPPVAGTPSVPPTTTPPPVTPPPPTTSAGPDIQPTPSPPAGTIPVAPSPDADAPVGDDSIQLPSGSVIAASFAAGMLTAFALARLKARRRYEPGLPAPGVPDDDPDMPDTMRDLLQRLDPSAEPNPAPSDAARPAPRSHDADAPKPGQQISRHPADQETAAPDREVGGPRNDRPGHPEEQIGAVVPVGKSNDTPVLLDLAAHPSLSITGPGAHGLVRIIVTSLLAGNGPHTFQVIALGSPPWSGVPDFPGLQHAPELDAAFHGLDTELLRRTRLLDAADASDLDAYRADPHGEPVPNILLVVAPHAAKQQPQRLHALLDQGHRLGVTALLIDVQLPEPGAVLEVDDAGRPVAAAPATLLDDPDNTRLYRMTETEAADFLDVLARSRHNDDDQQVTAPQTSAAVASQQESEADPAEVFGRNIPPADAPIDVGATTTPHAPDPLEPAEDATPIQVEVLGTYRVTVLGSSFGNGVRRKGLELLAFYLLHRKGALLDTAIEALWPNAPPVRGHQRVWTVLGDLRTHVRAALGDPESDVDVLIRDGHHYRFEPDLIDCDQWRFDAALADAANARNTGDSPAEITALQAAADTYGGELLPGLDYPWAAAPREHLHRSVINTLTRISDLHLEAGATAAAIAALERAIQISPATEKLYRHLMSAHAPDRDAINQTFERLKTALADLLDAEPSTESVELRDKLIRRRK